MTPFKRQVRTGAAAVLLLAVVGALWLSVRGDRVERTLDGHVGVTDGAPSTDIHASSKRMTLARAGVARHERKHPGPHALDDMGVAGVGGSSLATNQAGPFAGAEILARNPGPHMGDPIARDVEAAWNREATTHASAERENKVVELFGERRDAVQQVECKTSLCRIVFHADGLAASVPTAAKLGFDVAVLENNPERVVILLPVASVDRLTRT